MAKSQNYLFCPSPRILTCGGFSFFAILIAAMCLSPYVVADGVNVYQDENMPNEHDWTEKGFWSPEVVPSSGSGNSYFVGHNATTEKITFRTKHLYGASDVDRFPDGNTLWMGYNMDGNFSASQGELGLKARKFVINDLRLGNSIINNAIAETAGTVTLDGNMTVDGTVFFGINGVNKILDVQSAIEGAGVITLAEGFNNDNLKISHANNAFKGTLNVSKNSCVLLNAQNAMINASSFIINSGATLKLQGHQSSLNNLSGSGTVSFTGNALTLNNIATQVPVLSGNTEFSGVISGSGPVTVTKTGDGMLTFSGSGMYSGETNVQAGSLRLAGNALNDNWQIDVSSGATLEYFVDSGETKTVTLSEINKITCDDGTVAKTGAGALTLTGAKTYTGLTTVSGGVLELTGDAIVANGPITVEANGTLEYNLSSGQTKKLTITNASKIFSTGKVVKTGDGTLQIYTAAAGQVDASSFVVSSGRVDIKDYMNGKLEVESGATFSPGNSVGTLTIADSTYGPGGFILNDAGAELLMEIAGAAPSANDGLIVEGPITLEKDSIITLVNNSNLGRGESFTAILSANNSSTLDVLSHIQTTDFTELKYVQINDATHGPVYAITGRTFNANEVPEPSTWAMLALGVVGLMYWRKRK